MMKDERDAKYQAEYTLQTTAYSNAIDLAINHAGNQFECPLVNALAAAIIMTEAKLLASVPVDYRKTLLDSMNRFRPEAYAECTPSIKTEIIISHKDGDLQ